MAFARARSPFDPDAAIFLVSSENASRISWDSYMKEISQIWKNSALVMNRKPIEVNFRNFHNKHLVFWSSCNLFQHLLAGLQMVLLCSCEQNAYLCRISFIFDNFVRSRWRHWRRRRKTSNEMPRYVSKTGLHLFIFRFKLNILQMFTREIKGPQSTCFCERCSCQKESAF